MSSPALIFGWRTAVLGLASAQMLLLAYPLTRTLQNRTANRTLGALLVVLAGILTPFTIGFAGFYDRYPWLSFAPFAVPLAVGPLLFFYTHALAYGSLPRKAALHLAPAILQALYQTAGFLLPLAVKERWNDLSTPIVEPLVAIGMVAGLCGYSVASLRLLRRYRARLAEQRSDDDRHDARWLGRVVVAMLPLLLAWAGYDAWDRFVAPLDYFGVLGLYLVIAATGCYLAVEGWRHANTSFVLRPLLSKDAVAQPPPRDWRGQGEAWAERIRVEGWHIDPELSLDSLARLLATNSTHLSRALNEGLGMSFSKFVASLRCATVAQALESGRDDDLLSLALEAGFGSKATFNRAFLSVHGLTPSEYRRTRVSTQR